MASALFLVTGAAGFVGSHVAANLRARGERVIGCDNFNDYYDPALKRGRVAELLGPVGVPCEPVDIADAAALGSFFDRVRPSHVIHLAAQAGVRYSISHPQAYVDSNLVGFANVLEASRRSKIEHLVYASSSSVYGDCAEAPFHEAQPTDRPVSLYAATKKANELMAYAYSHVHGLRCTGLRFFTVYGPWGRPDMAYFSFAQKLMAGEALPIFGGGLLKRDFTYIDDIAEGVARLALSPRRPDDAAAEVFNIGNHHPVTVLDFVDTLARLLDATPRLNFLPMQLGDVPMTCADVSRLRARVGFEPATPLRDGLARFVHWFHDWRQRTHMQ